VRPLLWLLRLRCLGWLRPRRLREAPLQLQQLLLALRLLALRPRGSLAGDRCAARRHRGRGGGAMRRPRIAEQGAGLRGLDGCRLRAVRAGGAVRR
jgi:hypothetical protein